MPAPPTGISPRSPDPPWPGAGAPVSGDLAEADRWTHAAGLRLPGGEWSNDLQAPVAARHPDIARLVRLLRDTGAAVSAMSGSGSVVFGLFETRAAAMGAAVSSSAGTGQGARSSCAGSRDSEERSCTSRRMR